MKKIYLILVILLVGCSKQIKCEKDNNLITIISNENKIKNIQIEKTFKNSEETNNYCTLLKLTDVEVKCQKNTIVYNNYMDFLNKEFKLKNELIEYLEKEDYKCK